MTGTQNIQPASAADLPTFEHFLHTHIPLTRAMGLRLDALQADALRLHAPLAPNINDKGTAFGGSSASLMVIAGWSLLTLWLLRHGVQRDVVVFRADTRWQKPLTDALDVRARFVGAMDAALLDRVRSGKRAVKVAMASEVLNAAGDVCASMAGDYAVVCD